MKVSVVMSIFNGKKHLNNAIESILNQTYKDFEFIIVDDGSSDNSLEIIKSYAEKDKRIRIFKNSSNNGLTRSLNNAIRHSKGEYIARQDGDDISLPKRLEKQIKFLQENPDIAFCGCNGFQMKRKLDLTNTFDMTKIKRILIIENCFSHPTLVFRKRIFEKYGYYNEKFLYGQDYEILCRLIYKYNLKGKNLEDKLMIMNIPFTKIRIKAINKFFTQRFNSIITKIMYLRFTRYKVKCLFSILIRYLEMITLSHIMGKFTKYLIKINF